MKEEKFYPITNSPLYDLHSKAKAAKLLYTSVSFLQGLTPEQNYGQFSEPKPDGGLRQINAPHESLKTIQKRLLSLLRRIERPQWLISSARGVSYVDNARYHLDNPYVLTIDIRKFYDSCAHKHVHRLFRDIFRMSPDVAWIFSKLTTLNLKVPTGAPTSQIVAFLAYAPAFFSLHEIAQNAGCKFTLYVDDMTFSSDHPIDIPALLIEINRVLNPVGHRIKYGKVKYYDDGQCKLITGAAIDVDGVLRVPNKLRQRIMQDTATLKNTNASEETRTEALNSLRGRLHAARNIEPDIFPQIQELVVKSTR